MPAACDPNSTIDRAHESRTNCKKGPDPRVSNINARRTYLGCTVIQDMTERSGSGAPVHRYTDRKRDFELAIGDPAGIDRINEHIERHLGPVATVLHELISDLIHLDVHVVDPTPQRNYYTLVTSGMSDRAMNAPEGHSNFRYSELLICLPPTWPLTQEAWSNEEHYWPIRWLKMIGRFPHEHDTWLWAFHSVPNGEPARPFAPNTKLTGVVLVPPVTTDPAFRELRIDGTKTIHFHALVPLTSAEMRLKLDKGAEALFEGFEKHHVSELLDIGRRCTISRTSSWFSFWRTR